MKKEENGVFVSLENSKGKVKRKIWLSLSIPLIEVGSFGGSLRI